MLFAAVLKGDSCVELRPCLTLSSFSLDGHDWRQSILEVRGTFIGDFQN